MYSNNLTSSFSPAPCCHQMIFPASPYIGLSFDKKANLTKMTMTLVEKDKRGRVCLDYARYILVC